MTTEQIDRVENLIGFVNDNPSFKNNLDNLIMAYTGKSYFNQVGFLYEFVEYNNGKEYENLMKRWKKLLAEQK